MGRRAHPKLSSTGRVVVFDTLAGAAFSPLATPVPNSIRQVVGITQQPQLSIADIDVGTGIVGLPSSEWFVRLYNAGPVSLDKLDFRGLREFDRQGLSAEERRTYIARKYGKSR